MRHLLAATLWFVAGCLLTGVIAETMERRAVPGGQMMALQTGPLQEAALRRGPGDPLPSRFR